MPEPDPTDGFHIRSSRPQRLDHALNEHFPHLPRGALRAAIISGAIRVNGRRRHKGDLVYPGDLVTFPDDLATPALRGETNLPVAVLYTDPDLVAVDKPAGMPSVALRATDRGTLANFLVARFPETAPLGDHPFECGVTHRLDTDTSGALLVARNREVYRELRRAFRRRRVEKLYSALVHGRLAAPRTITAALRASGRRGARTVLATRPEAATARHAETEIWPEEICGATTLVGIRIATGVRHQIRVHLASIGHPVVGDRLYGRGDDAQRLMLHAHRIRFAHPRGGAAIDIEAPLPEAIAIAARRG